MLTEISNRSEYTKSLEQIFMFILEVFMKKNDGNCFGSTSPANLLNSLKNSFEGMTSSFESATKDVSVDLNVNQLKQNQFPMLDYKLKQIKQYEKTALGSVSASPSFFTNAIYQEDFDHRGGNFEFFDNINKSPILNSGNNTPRLQIEDYLNVSDCNLVNLQNRNKESFGCSSNHQP